MELVTDGEFSVGEIRRGHWGCELALQVPMPAVETEQLR
jgi:hypothetical protein